MTENQPQSGDSTGAPASNPGLSGPSRFLITAAAFVIVIAGMKQARDIIVPFLLAVFLAIISTPLLFWFRKKGLSSVFAILIVSFIMLLAGLMVGTLLTASIADLSKDLPRYTAKLDRDIRAWEQSWHQWLEEHSFDSFFYDPNTLADFDENDEPLPPAAAQNNTTNEIQHPETFSLSSLVDAPKVMGLMADLLAQLGSILAGGFFIYLTMVFILLEASILPAKIKATMHSNPQAYENLSTIGGNVKKYLAMKTIISLATGILVAVWLIILRVNYPIVWGLIAFLLNFVPSIGSIIAAVPATALALLQLGPGPAMMTALGYLVVNVVIGNIIEPRLMGQRLGLSTLVVFLSLIFWGWVLGPMGMLLSVPLTMTVKIVLESHPDTRLFAILLGSQNPPPSRHQKQLPERTG